MNRNELVKQALNGGNLFELIEDYQHSVNPHRLHRESEAYQAFRAGQFKRLVYWLLVQIRAQNTPKYEVIEHCLNLQNGMYEWVIQVEGDPEDVSRTVSVGMDDIMYSYGGEAYLQRNVATIHEEPDYQPTGDWMPADIFCRDIFTDSEAEKYLHNHIEKNGLPRFRKKKTQT